MMAEFLPFQFKKRQYSQFFENFTKKPEFGLSKKFLARPEPDPSRIFFGPSPIGPDICWPEPGPSPTFAGPTQPYRTGQTARKTTMM